MDVVTQKLGAEHSRQNYQVCRAAYTRLNSTEISNNTGLLNSFLKLTCISFLLKQFQLIFCLFDLRFYLSSRRNFVRPTWLSRSFFC